MSKIWPNDARVDHKAPSNLVKWLDFELDLKQEFDKFENSFEQDELKET